MVVVAVVVVVVVVAFVVVVVVAVVAVKNQLSKPSAEARFFSTFGLCFCRLMLLLKICT